MDKVDCLVGAQEVIAEELSLPVGNRPMRPGAPMNLSESGNWNLGILYCGVEFLDAEFATGFISSAILQFENRII